MHLRPMEPRDRIEIAELICVSTNYWYQSRGAGPIFAGGPESTVLFFDVYEALDPGCGVVAENPANGRIMGSCFFHPRETHVSLGIMNVHPNYFGRKVARALLKYITDYADANGYPATRLVQSAMNLDSYSLYTRAGFVPRYAYQDMLVKVPAAGIVRCFPGQERVRPATLADVPKLASLEREVAGIAREKDYRFFIENQHGIWAGLVYEGESGQIDGFMFSSKHSGSNMVGPGVARTEQQALALTGTALDRYRGGAAVLLAPVVCYQLVAALYDLGAVNVEIHFCQVRGQYQPFAGISMPVFLPESA